MTDYRKTFLVTKDGEFPIDFLYLRPKCVFRMEEADGTEVMDADGHTLFVCLSEPYSTESRGSALGVKAMSYVEYVRETTERTGDKYLAERITGAITEATARGIQMPRRDGLDQVLGFGFYNPDYREAVVEGDRALREGRILHEGYEEARSRRIGEMCRRMALESSAADDRKSPEPVEITGPPPRKGAIARCSLGMIGLVTTDTPEPVTYGDGNTGHAFQGVQLGFKTFDGPGGSYRVEPGDPWSSRSPDVIGYASDVEEAFALLRRKREGKLIDLDDVAYGVIDAADGTRYRITDIGTFTSYPGQP